ncbi:SEC10/PgrA surface exclusion domain-containing protein [Levilactobacillus fujinensis]|uniref:SEC10/PgrA surface exclusion domain-containing protein n=1 Tax=Levilactobacillus fujinensis TaxID=2486024 RepID=A0ABW1TEG0_9LACO|nr:SEC10/PgrA surface exclusion domain-containing protein [Levilactobacillus fujinensis]
MKEPQNKALLAAAATMMTTGILVATNNFTAQADTITPTTAATTKSTPTQDLNQAKEEAKEQQQQAESTQAQANQAKVTADASSTEASKAQNTAKQAKEALDVAKENQTTAQVTADEATPTSIKQAQEDVVTQQTVNQKDAQQVAVDQSKVNTAQTTVNDADAQVDSAKRADQTATKAVTNAQADVSAAQKIVDGVGNTSQALSNLTQAQAAAEKAKDNVAKTQNTVTQTTSAVSSNTTKVNNAQANATQTQTDLNIATNAVTQTKTAVANAQAKLENAQNQVGDTNIITVTPDYVSALNKTLTDISDNTQQAVSAAATTALAANTYQDNMADQAIKINNATDLTDPVRTELSTFAVNLINDIRQQFGLENLSVTVGSQKLANEIAQGYEADNWMIAEKMAHDVTLLSTAAHNNGFTGIGENAGTIFDGSLGSPNWNLSVNDFKKMIYNDMLSLAFNDSTSSWGHATNFIRDYSYAGVSISTFKLSEGLYGTPLLDNQHLIDAHYVFAPAVNLVDSSKFDATTIVTPTALTPAEIATLAQKLEVAKTQATAANTALLNAQAAATAAKSALISAQSSLATSKQAQTQAQIAANQAQTQLKSTTQAADSAQAIVNSLTADAQTKQATLTVAKQALAEAQANQVAKQTVVAAKQALLSAAQVNLDEARAKLTKDTNTLQAGQTSLKLKQAKVLKLQHAKDSLAEAKSAMTQAQAKYEVLAKQAETAKNVANHDQITYQNLLVEADKAQAKLADAQALVTRLQNLDAVNNQLNVVSPAVKTSVKPTTNSKVKNTAKTNVPKKLTSRMTKHSEKNVSEKKASMPTEPTRNLADEVTYKGTPTNKVTQTAHTLPQTNASSENFLTVAGVILATLLGLFGWKTLNERKRRF